MQPRADVAIEREGVVRNLLAAIAVDRVDAILEQRLVRIAPPRVGVRVGEIDDTALGQRQRAVGAE